MRLIKITGWDRDGQMPSDCCPSLGEGSWENTGEGQMAAVHCNKTTEPLDANSVTGSNGSTLLSSHMNVLLEISFRLFYNSNIISKPTMTSTIISNAIYLPLVLLSYE